MTKESAIMVVPNTKNGLAALKELASVTIEHDVYIKIVSKKEFDLMVKSNETERCLVNTKDNHCHPAGEECLAKGDLNA